MLSCVSIPAAPVRQPFKITVVDQATGRGVPLVELRTVNEVLYVTDSNGIVAFSEPGLMDQDVFFSLKSHGYEFPKDGFGNRGTRLRITPGGSARLKIKRLNIAERLYRVTGEGIYRDSVLVGEAVPLAHPLLNGQVFGQDTVMAIPYRGKLYWFWGDTNRPSYPLGHFRTSGATSALPGQGGLDPAVGVDLTYFVDNSGFSRPMVALPDIAGGELIWIEGLMTIADDTGQERLVAHYDRLRSMTETLGQGLIVFNDATNTFEPLARFDVKNPLYPRQHPFRHTVAGAPYYYFAQPYPNLRVPATWAAIQDPAAYEAFTPLVAGSRYTGVNTPLERDAAGRLVFAWKRDTEPLWPDAQRALVKAGKMKAEESPFNLEDRDTGALIQAHRSSVCWNDYRKRWIMIAVQQGGKSSFLGEVWYAEAPAPEGPWRLAKRIVTHDRYSFYNPAQHPFFDQDGGRIIYFEGTYTKTFSGNDVATPRYDYNQIMYRLELSDERLRRNDTSRPVGS